MSNFEEQAMYQSLDGWLTKLTKKLFLINQMRDWQKKETLRISLMFLEPKYFYTGTEAVTKNTKLLEIGRKAKDR